MNAEEMGKVLGRAALYDYREVSDEDVAAWLMILGHLTYKECDEAVIYHYKYETRRLMPADIRLRVLAEREQWLREHPNVGPQHPEIVAPWQAGQRELESGS